MSVTQLENVYVLILRDKYDEDLVSCVLGPFEGLAATQEARAQLVKEHEDLTFRRFSIERCRGLKLPEWEGQT